MMSRLSSGLHLVIGGARSGKSRYAEKLLEVFPPPRYYVATARILDDEMANRVKLHKKRRGSDWTTIEAPFDLPSTLRELCREFKPILVDCITMWLTNVLLSNEQEVMKEVENLCNFFRKMDLPPVVCVTNEVGLGVVPENTLARQFRDVAGICNQMLADVAKTVTWIVAGIPVRIKS